MRPTHTASPLRCASAPNRAICAPKTPEAAQCEGKIIGDRSLNGLPFLLTPRDQCSISQSARSHRSVRREPEHSSAMTRRKDDSASRSA